LRLGILQRYVIDQVLRAFVMALLTVTAVFVLLMVMTAVSREALPPQDVLRLLPYIVPGSLPYTIPVALLFAVSVVYGRLASDNEVVAVKAAGLSASTILWPSLFLGLASSLGLLAISTELIPRANNRLKQIILGDMEETFYRFLKKEGEFSSPGMPFFIQVRDVEGHVLIDPLFKHRSPSPPAPPNQFDLQVKARKAVVQFDTQKNEATVTLLDATSSGGKDTTPFLFWINGKQVLKYPIPKPPEQDHRVQEMTNNQINRAQAEFRSKIQHERARQAVGAAFWIASGRLDRIDWPGIGEAYRKYDYWQRKVDEYETEKYQRVALAFGGFFFVLLGAPVGILFARRDFLSAFISCFIPIIIIYYPLTLMGVNLGKEGIVHPVIVFVGNLVVGALAGFFAIPPVRRH
jgi:lipopolysaccharide export system permease protein